MDHASNYFATALTSDHEVMIEPWRSGQKPLDRLTLLQASTAVAMRLRREDAVAAWLIERIAELASDATFNDHADTVMMMLARFAADGFVSAHMPSIQQLAARPESCFLTDTDGNTALMVAVQEGRIAIALELLKAGADPEHHNLRGLTMIDLAHESRKPLDMITALVNWLNQHDKISALMRQELRDFFYDALSSNNKPLMEMLRPYADDLQQEMARAIGERAPKAQIELLIAMGADVFGKDARGTAWVELAAQHGAGELMGFLRLRQAQHQQTQHKSV